MFEIILFALHFKIFSEPTCIKFQATLFSTTLIKCFLYCHLKQGSTNFIFASNRAVNLDVTGKLKH